MNPTPHNSNLRATLSEFALETRRYLEMSQEEIAELIAASVREVREMESGEKIPELWMFLEYIRITDKAIFKRFCEALKSCDLKNLSDE